MTEAGIPAFDQNGDVVVGRSKAAQQVVDDDFDKRCLNRLRAVILTTSAHDGLKAKLREGKSQKREVRPPLKEHKQNQQKRKKEEADQKKEERNAKKAKKQEEKEGNSKKPKKKSLKQQAKDLDKEMDAVMEPTIGLGVAKKNKSTK
jgi:hypothetical protein